MLPTFFLRGHYFGLAYFFNTFPNRGSRPLFVRGSSRLLLSSSPSGPFTNSPARGLPWLTAVTAEVFFKGSDRGVFAQPWRSFSHARGSLRQRPRVLPGRIHLLIFYRSPFRNKQDLPPSLRGGWRLLYWYLTGSGCGPPSLRGMEVALLVSHGARVWSSESPGDGGRSTGISRGPGMIGRFPRPEGARSSAFLPRVDLL